MGVPEILILTSLFIVNPYSGFLNQGEGAVSDNVNVQATFFIEKPTSPFDHLAANILVKQSNLRLQAFYVVFKFNE